MSLSEAKGGASPVAPWATALLWVEVDVDDALSLDNADDGESAEPRPTYHGLSLGLVSASSAGVLAVWGAPHARSDYGMHSGDRQHLLRRHPPRSESPRGSVSLSVLAYDPVSCRVVVGSESGEIEVMCPRSLVSAAAAAPVATSTSAAAIAGMASVASIAPSRVRAHESGVRALVVAPDADAAAATAVGSGTRRVRGCAPRLLVSSGDDGAIRVWSLPELEPRGTFHGAFYPEHDFHIGGRGALGTAGGGSGARVAAPVLALCVAPPPPPPGVSRRGAEQGGETNMGATATVDEHYNDRSCGTLLVSGDARSTISIWDLRTRTFIRAILAHSDAVSALACSRAEPDVVDGVATRSDIDADGCGGNGGNGDLGDFVVFSASADASVMLHATSRERSTSSKQSSPEA